MKTEAEIQKRIERFRGSRSQANKSACRHSKAGDGIGYQIYREHVNTYDFVIAALEWALGK